MSPVIQAQRTVFSQGVTVEEATVLHKTADGRELRVSRSRVRRPDAAAVLVHNTETGKVVLVKQFRYAVADRIKEPLPEIVAGKVDPGEEPLDTAVRECFEECGYRVARENMVLLASFFASPGYTSEKYFLYYAPVLSQDRVEQGGGLPEENEFIEVVETDAAEFLQRAENNGLEDGKTLMAVLLAKNRLLP
jgi:nudix-type nucleoside diphosphatase (YffH/AdpP family)